MSASTLYRAALICAVATVPALAQDTVCFCQTRHERTPTEFERRSSGNISFIQSRPTGALQKNIGFGYGANLAYLFRLDHAGFLSLRGDAGFAVYGDEHFHAPLSSTIGGRIQVKVNTNNYIVPLSIGPQLTWPRGPVRPYVNAGLGAQVFFTESGVEGSEEEWEFANTTNQSDWTSMWLAGGGIYFPVYQKKASVLIDLGAQFIRGGRAQYLRPGSIEDLPDAQIRITPLESETHLLLVHLGVRIGL